MSMSHSSIATKPDRPYHWLALISAFVVATSLDCAHAEPSAAEAVTMRAQALSMLQAQRVEVFSQLRQQVASAEQSLASAKLYRNGILPQAQLTVESALAVYRVNRVDFLTLLDNQMTVFNYEIGYPTSLVNYDKALFEIEFVTGKARFPRGGGQRANEREPIRSVGGQPYMER